MGPIPNPAWRLVGSEPNPETPGTPRTRGKPRPTTATSEISMDLTRERKSSEEEIAREGEEEIAREDKAPEYR